MKLVRPVVLADAGPGPYLVSSTVADPAPSDPAAWSSATTYALGAMVRVGRDVYQSRQAANANKPPATNPDWWAPAGAVSRYAMFDGSVGSATTAPSPLVVVMRPGIVDALVLLGLVGNTATVQMSNGGAVVYSRTFDLQIPTIADWYGYFFEPFRQVAVVIMNDLPPYLNGELTVAVTGDGSVSCGACIPGRLYTVGGTLYGVRAGIRDYSTKVTDPDTGFTTLKQGKFAKLLTAQIQADSGLFNEISDQLELVRGTACVWIGDDTGEQAGLTVYGFYKDFRLSYEDPSRGIYSLEIEGLA